MGIQIFAVLVVAAAIGSSAPAEAARPRIGVVARIAPRETLLVQTMRGELQGKAPEAFIAARFIDTIQQLQMFEFYIDTETASNEAKRVILEIGAPTKSAPWPVGDVIVKLVWQPDDVIVPITLFENSLCAIPPCRPPSFANNSWYQDKFGTLLQDWPDGLFKSVVIHGATMYRAGDVTIPGMKISELGQRKLAPSAIFEIEIRSMEDRDQRPVVFCKDTPQGVIGIDQGDAISPLACYKHPPAVGKIRSGTGSLTLLRVLKRRASR